MVLIASSTTNKKTQIIDTQDSFISLSKGRCTNASAVYDLWVFKSGKVVYNGIENVNKRGTHVTNISLDDIFTLEKLIPTIKIENIGPVKGRNNPLSILRIKNKKIVYQAKRTNGSLLYINNLIENLQKKINN